MLQKVILELPKEEAETHMKRCVASGLWVPNAGEAAEGGGEEDGGEKGDDEGYEEVYEEVEWEKEFCSGLWVQF